MTVSDYMTCPHIACSYLTLSLKGFLSPATPNRALKQFTEPNRHRDDNDNVLSNAFRNFRGEDKFFGIFPNVQETVFHNVVLTIA